MKKARMNISHSRFILFNTLTADWFSPKLLKNAKRIRAKVRLPQSYEVDFWQQLNLFEINHAKKIPTSILVVGT